MSQGGFTIMDMRVWNVDYAGQEILAPPITQVLVSMRDHALRRLVANVLRADGVVVVEAFDMEATFEELRRSNHLVQAILLDARRDSFETTVEIARLRAIDPNVGLIALNVRRDEAFEGAANRRGALVMQLPMTSRNLRLLWRQTAGNVAHPERVGGSPVL
jgi:DNA-binding response OmpR family regulator